MEHVKQKKYTYFIGTDISRNKLDHAVMKGKVLLFHRETGNDKESISDFISELKKLPGFTLTRAVFCMEQTGIYTNHLIYGLQRLKTNLVVEAPLQIRNSLGNIRSKNDKIDAIRIAEYAYKSREHLRLYIPRRLVIQQLADLTSIRTRLVNLRLILTIPLQEQISFVKKGIAKEGHRLCQRSSEALKDDLIEVEQTISDIMAADERLKQLMKLITSVKGVGPVTATHIIICTNEFRDINNPKKFACYAGVAPFVKESGNNRGRPRVSKVANKKMKSLLHTCAIQAIRLIPELKAYFLRKTVVEGKHKMSVYNALRYKMILRIFACVNQNRCYEQTHIRESSISQATQFDEQVFNGEIS
ncbi:transposase [Pedobacter africanus]|uniref:Transposase n=1 Tax=Pedobacter africanus TaxID=151894 RepID=A0ACC6KW41_9SPHI|nr:IS110 family transposase [Pedobacter africanus]MDR6783303.1 transposase [Pedobacter africanus]